MRTEQEMVNLILGVAKNDERIRAVYLNGSRANPNVTKDQYQDFDIVFVVTETKSFLINRNWITIFGNIAMVQEPDAPDFGWGEANDLRRAYTWLILFKDGNRIDLHIEIIEEMFEKYTKDSLTIPLLDKDQILPKIASSNDSDYWIKEPVEAQYKGCCNEFWWCLNNIAKGIIRDQLPYAMRMYYETVHQELDKMLQWYIGIDTHFNKSVGMWGKYFKKYLSLKMYALYEKTFSNSNYENLWSALFSACELFRVIAKFVGEHFDYVYNHEDDENMTRYLLDMRNEYTKSI